MELQASRLRARIGPHGAVLLADQDRTRWDHLLVQRGLAELRRAEELSGALGPYALQAGSPPATHAPGASSARTGRGSSRCTTASLRSRLAGRRGQPRRRRDDGVRSEAGLELIDVLADEPALRGYHLMPGVRGDILMRLGRRAEARAEFERAAELCDNERERELLLSRELACRA